MTDPEECPPWRGRFIDWTIERVDAAIAKHGLVREEMLRDPKLELLSDPPIDLVVERFKAGRPRQRQYDDRSPGQLRDDVTRVTDISLRLIKERDDLLKEKATAEIQAASRNTWIQILGAVASVELILVGFFATQFFARLK